MDRISLCGSDDLGSIPSESTNNKKHTYRYFVLESNLINNTIS